MAIQVRGVQAQDVLVVQDGNDTAVAATAAARGLQLRQRERGPPPTRPDTCE
jgi:hypothetical protein